MKTIFLSGRLTADPEINVVGDKDSKLAKFTIANNDGGKEQAEFYDVHCWDVLADLAENNLKKGNKIVLQGTFANSYYVDKEGRKRSQFEITAYKVEFAG